MHLSTYIKAVLTAPIHWGHALQCAPQRTIDDGAQRTQSGKDTETSPKESFAPPKHAARDAEAEGSGQGRPDPLNVGGQAVLEGVMMRSAHSFAVACRRPDGKIVVRESAWRSIWERWRFMRWPFFRGGVVLVESLVNGFSALSFSAAVQEGGIHEPGEGEDRAVGASPKDADQQDAQPESPALSGAAVGLTLVVSIGLALGLFVGLPHLAAWLMGLAPDTFSFHIVDGVLKAVLVVGYLGAISLMEDIRRVFMYHGAEHQSIAAYEAGKDLIVEEARKHTRFHPRCGTSFLFLVILISILLFAITLRATWIENGFFDQLLKIGVKIPMMLPVAGISYEALKLSGRFKNSRLAMVLVAPGLWLQRLTTRSPEDDQIAVGLASLRKTLWRESVGVDADSDRKPTLEVVDTYRDIAFD